MDIDVKIHEQPLVNQIQQYFKRIIHHDQMDFTTGM